MTWLLQQCMMQLKTWDGLGIQGPQQCWQDRKMVSSRPFFKSLSTWIENVQAIKPFINFHRPCLLKYSMNYILRYFYESLFYKFLLIESSTKFYQLFF
jgi:hypothetical protein